MNKIKILAVAVLAVGVLGGAYAAGFLDFLNPNSFVEYESERFGYTISYPRNWTMDDSHSKALLDVIYNGNKTAVVLIQVFEHDSYATEEGRTAGLASMKKDLETRPEYKLNYFNSEIVDGETRFAAHGLYRDANGIWDFHQTGAFLGDRKAYNIVTRILTGSVDEQKAVTDKIVASFKI